MIYGEINRIIKMEYINIGLSILILIQGFVSFKTGWIKMGYFQTMYGLSIIFLEIHLLIQK